MTVASTPLLSVRGLVKCRPGVMALQGLDFAVRADEAHCLLGQNGAGKSTLTKMLSGAHRPDEGEIRRPGETVEFGNPAELSTMDSTRRVETRRRTCALLERLGHTHIFRDRIHHVDREDARCQDGKGRMGSHLPRPGPWRGWDFVSTGHGDVPWERSFRMFDTIGCAGPISVDWEDAGTNRLVGCPRHWSSFAATLSTRRRRHSARAAAESAGVG